MEAISIIIPTHNRSHILKRAIEYYTNIIQCQIIICDSSNLKDEFAAKKKDIIYLHYPNLTFASKLLFGVKKSKTKYVCISADDDFLTKTGLLSACIFLNQNDDFVSAQGKYTQFTYIGNRRVIFGQLYGKNINNQLESNVAEDRIVSSMQPYFQQIFSLHRREALHKAIELASMSTYVTNVEISCNLVPMIYGKHKVLDEFWMARDSRRYTTYNLSGNNQNTVISNYHKYFETDEGKKLIFNYGVIFGIINNTLSSTGEDVFKNAFEKYFKGAEEKKIKKLKFSEAFKFIFTKLIPKSIIYIRRKHLMNKLSFAGENIAKSSDWLNMKKIIIDHGFLKEQIDIRL